MDESKSSAGEIPKNLGETQPKWDYTTRNGTLFTGAVVVVLNLILIIFVILDRTVPSVHSFITGKPV